MGLKDDFNNDVYSIINSDFLDLTKEILFRSYTGQTIQPGGIVTPTYNDNTVRALEVSTNEIVKQNEINRRVVAGETLINNWFTFLVAIKGLTFTPSTQDKIVMPSSRELIISKISIDPSESLYKIMAGD